MKKIVGLMLAILMIGSIALFASCDNTKPIINGVQDIHIKANTENYDFLKDVSVDLAKDSTENAEVDLGDLDLTTAGSYEITYSYKDVTSTCNVYVYETPKLYYDGNELGDSLTISYTQASENGFDYGITAKDSFNNSLEVTVSGDEFDELAKDYEVIFYTKDRVDNEVFKTVTITVTEEGMPIPVATSITGVKDLDIKVNDTDFDFLNGVVANMDNDTTAVPTLDITSVNFTQAGTYVISYTKDSITETCNVKVYEAPEFFFAEALLGDSIEREYGDVQNGIIDGITAKDSFDGSLEIALSGDEFTGLAGSFNVILDITDKAGNSVTKTVAITVTNNKAPSVIVDVSYDITLDQYRLDCDKNEAETLTLKYNGAAVDAANYSFENNYLIIKGSYLRTLGIGEFTFNAFTELGYSDFDITVEDNDLLTVTTRNPDALRQATITELENANFSGSINDLVYVYHKRAGYIAAPGNIEEVYIPTSINEVTQLTFDVYVMAWTGNNEPHIAIENIPVLSLINKETQANLTLTPLASGGAYSYIDRNVWYTVTVDVSNTDKTNIVPWISNEVDLLITNIVGTFDSGIAETIIVGTGNVNSIRSATTEELTTANYTGTDENAYFYHKTQGVESGPGQPDELYIRTVFGVCTQLSFDAYFVNWSGNNDPHFDIEGGRILSIIDKETSSELTLTNGYWTYAELNKWYTITVDVSAFNKTNIVIWVNNTVDMLLTDIDGTLDESKLIDIPLNVAKPSSLKQATDATLESINYETDIAVYTYHKTTGILAGPGNAEEVYIANDDGYSTITFDVYILNWSGSNNPHICIDGARVSSIIKQETQESITLTALGNPVTGDWTYVEAGKWYTVTVNASTSTKINLVPWANNTADILIANISGTIES